MKSCNLLLFISLALFSFFAKGNNIQVSNVNLNGNVVKFNLSWDNSWNDSVNHDAAWVFIKYRYPSSNWQHAILQTTGHIAPNGSTIDTPTDGLGVFIYRNSGTGNNSFQNIQLAWNLMANGIASTDSIQVKVFAIEMVYVPQGAFYIGDGSSSGSLRQVSSNTPLQISTTPVIVKCGSTSYDDAQLIGNGILVDGDNGIDMSGTTTISNPDYPTGYKAFYCEKYEISQGQYADFLNTLTAVQCTSRYYISSAYRYTISGSWPLISAAAPDRVCNWINWSDGCAYADWSGLRPMTELEYEKACRGPLPAITGEYAWGNTFIYNNAYTLINNGLSNELVTNPGISTGNANFSSTNSNIGGPLRCGIFAASAVTKNRIETGATYYGIMEMSGSMWEHMVTLGSPVGRAFSGLNGNGMLNTAGNADVINWPGNVSGAVTGADGSGFRGGSWYVSANYLQISSRYYSAYVEVGRDSPDSFRPVRSAP